LGEKGKRLSPSFLIRTVVAAILTIAAIDIPNYIQSKTRANGAAAVQSLRNIATAELVYSTTYGINPE